jgi:hypothetical protein
MSSAHKKGVWAVGGAKKFDSTFTVQSPHCTAVRGEARFESCLVCLTESQLSFICLVSCVMTPSSLVRLKFSEEHSNSVSRVRIEGICSSETCILAYQTSRRHNPDDYNMDIFLVDDLTTLSILRLYSFGMWMFTAMKTANTRIELAKAALSNFFI